MKVIYFFIFFAHFFLITATAFAVDLTSGQHSFEFHGYLRSSLGLSEGGTTQAKFQLPGARSKYRLGNEPDTSLELQFDYTYKLKNPENKNANIKSVIMIDGYKNLGESSDFAVENLSQAYLSFNNFFNDDVNFWIGRRYYHRKAIHIMNHFWLNPGQKSHIGIGFEGQRLGSGKFDLALFRNEDTFALTNSNHLINSTVLDARWHSLPVSKNIKLTAWGQLASRHASASLNYASKSGYSMGGWMDYAFNRIKNTTVLLYQNGATITQSGTNPRVVREDQGWNLDDAMIFEVSNMLTYENLSKHSFQWSLLYHQEDRGTAGNSKINWASTGIRPIFYLSKHVNIALEAGIDYVDDKLNNRRGSLEKFTIALQLAADRGFKSRPVLRIFATVAQWDDDFKGLVGNIPGDAPYANDVDGWTVGAQVESWW